MKKRGLVMVSVAVLIVLAVVAARIYANAYTPELLPVPEIDFDLALPPAVRAPPRGAEINLDRLPPPPALRAPPEPADQDRGQRLDDDGRSPAAPRAPGPQVR